MPATGLTAHRAPAVQAAVFQQGASHQSEALCGQATEALQSLAFAFCRADSASGGRLLADWNGRTELLREGFASVVLRCAFLLHAEARGLAPGELGRLADRLIAGRGDATGSAAGAWPRLLEIFRDAARRGAATRGSLFDHERHPFLGAAEGIPDTAVRRLLELLSRVGGEPVRFEQIELEAFGAIFESLLDFELVRARGRAVAVGPDHACLDLDELLATAPNERARLVEDRSGSALSPTNAAVLGDATSVGQLVQALGRRLSPRTPAPMPPGTLMLQPGPERRRSGAHYTPRSLTEPIVRDALAPLLAARSGTQPEQILGLGICDPAMGSGAFLLEACRQLAAELGRTGGEADPARLRAEVARRCLYGVDRNPGAVEAARLSLWLLVADPELPFGFLDHALKCGDGLVGLTRDQLAALHWDAGRPAAPGSGAVDRIVGRAAQLRACGVERPEALAEADRAAEPLRAAGDLVVGLFFEHADERSRRAAFEPIGGLEQASKEGARAAGLCARHRLRPFHWPLEFPEIFARGRPGFDVLLGNPPFLGGSSISSSFGGGYRDWLLRVHAGSHGNADLCAHFLRRAWGLLRDGGALGMIATKTIAEGDTRASALQPILAEGGTLRSASRNLPWPGAAVVAVSVLQLTKGPVSGARRLDGAQVAQINSRLRPSPERPDPVPLAENAGRCYLGSKLYGEGFVLSPGEREELVAADPANAGRIRPYIGGEEVNRSPTQSFSRYVIDFGELSLEEASRWPLLLERVRERVKPERDRNRRDSRRIHWWRFGETCPALYSALRGRERCLVTPRVTKHLAFSLQPTDRVFNEKLNVFTFADFARFAVLQSRVHSAWVRLLSSTIGVGQLNYSGSDCFDTFPFPDEASLLETGALAAAGERLYRARAALMAANGFGLTETYNRLADPDCAAPAIVELRGLHFELDRAVCEAFGWDRVRVPPYGPSRGSAALRPLSAFEDEVIDRLFALNSARSEAALRSAAQALRRTSRNAR